MFFFLIFFFFSESEEVFIDTSGFPSTYKNNSQKEKLMLAFAENFRQQYAHLFPDRKPLFLTPRNECGIEKFVSTTIRPTLLSYEELYSWDGCAEFVSDYLTMYPLKPPIDPPQVLHSPVSILKCQQGNCFDFSVLLCSLLIGAGYDAYSVSGYAVKEMCLNDETREICPLLRKREEKGVEEKKPVVKKYAVKPPRDLNSRFEMNQETKRKRDIAAALEKKKMDEEKRIAELEKPPLDPLYGLRVHCWVLVLAGKREVSENFFIDPITGHSYQTTDKYFLGIESLWNHENYWVNMQDCRHGTMDMTFDLGDPVCWEFMLLGSGKPLLSIPDMDEEELQLDDEMGEKEEEFIFYMPPSWVERIEVSPKDFETRCPNGKKTILYRKAVLEKFAPYLMKDGLVMKLTVYEDTECSRVLEVKEWFENRRDKLDLRELKQRSNLIVEHFIPGRSDALKTHIYKTLVPETERTMEFYNEARVDGLQKREENPCEMKETFVGRPDFLSYRHTVFGKRVKKVMLSGSTETNNRPILKITELFHRNPEKLANEDVEQQVFLISENRIQLTYHLESDKIIASKRQFLKPPNAGEKGNQVVLTTDMISTFQVDPTRKPCKDVFLYEMFMNLLETEKQLKQIIRESEQEVCEILQVREQEETMSELQISVYDTERNEKGKKLREALEQQRKEELKRQKEREMDYLAPFLAQQGDPTALTKKQAIQLRNDCLADLKKRLINKANLIQRRFEKETQELQKKQQWYQQNQVSMTKEDEEDYLCYCSNAMFQIHILELRLNRHKELAPAKYLAMEERLNRDPRLAEYLK
uniref:Dynein regulatory complex subunit 7 n=1 Tax=Latimeria chalumnae TaxID=7897 RepID=M3XIL3_LATCH|nr:PREDICTED: dynein regulatory complex subunit 7 [Latimeria chalumnae]|eukprot:XP_014352781.1 PREDICTED: dynein regulatory complex subunit 7 [Latimeria chalumnae]